jgi:ATP-dependent DNA helicase RecG
MKEHFLRLEQNSAGKPATSAAGSLHHDIYDLNDFFKVVLSNQKAAQKSTQKTALKTAQKSTQKSTREKVLDILTETPNITRERIAFKLDISTNAIKKHLANLKKDGMLERVGPDKGGYWKVLK